MNYDPKRTKMVHNMKLSCLTLVAVTALIACRKDDPVVPLPPAPNEEELITTVRLTFTSSGGTETKEFLFSDLDGVGGNPPVITADPLSADSLYSVSIELLNASVTPAVDVSAEVAAEAEAHQFFYQVSGANATVSYADTDGNGNPIGLSTEWTLGASSAGTVVVTLRHLPDKSGNGVSSGEITNAGGETDIEVSFPLVIQ